MHRINMWRFVYIAVLCVYNVAQGSENAKEINILWNKYGDLRADVETIKADVKTNSNTNKKVDLLEEDLQELKDAFAGSTEKPNKEGTLRTTTDTDDNLTTRGPMQYIPESTEWQLIGSSIYEDHNGNTVITVDYLPSGSNDNVIWFIDGVAVLGGNKDFSVSGETVGNHQRTKLTASVHAAQLTDLAVRVSFEQQMKYFNRKLSVDLSLNTSVITDRNEYDNFGFFVSLNQSNTTDSLEQLFELGPTTENNLNYSLTYLDASFIYINDSNHDVSLQYIGTYDSRGLLSKQDITRINGHRKAKIILDNELQSFGGYLGIFAGIQLKNNLIINTVGIGLQLPGVFTNNEPVDHLKGKFAIESPHYTYFDINGTGMINCFSLGYPVPGLELLKVNPDNSTSMIPFENEVMYIQRVTFVQILMVVPNVTTEMEGRYACVGHSGNVRREMPFNLHVTKKAHFDDSATTLETLADGKLVVNITAFGDPKPYITCRENEEDGEEFVSALAGNFTDMLYGYALQPDQTTHYEERKTIKTIIIDPANNGTTYGPLYQLVCVTTRHARYPERNEDVIVVKL